MKILLIGNYLPDGQKSMNAFLNMLNGALAADHQVDVVVPSNVMLSYSWIPTKLKKWFAYVDKFIIFAIKLIFIKRKYDVVHICDHSNSLYCFFLSGVPHTIACHDVIAIQAAKGLIPGWVTGTTGKIFQKLILAGLKRANHIFCVSHLTQKDLISLDKKFINKSTVIQNPLNNVFVPMNDCADDLRALGLNQALQSGYFIHVGSDLPRKNRIYVVSIYSYLIKFTEFSGARLVFVGPGPNSVMQKLIDDLNLNDKIHFIKDVAHSELNALYSSAISLIFPSKNEGFGWPVAEAQACGCPVFASNVAPMPEVGGGAARYFPLDDPELAAKIITQANMAEMVEQGLENVKRFTTEKMAKELKRAWGDIVKK